EHQAREKRPPASGGEQRGNAERGGQQLFRMPVAERSRGERVDRHEGRYEQAGQRWPPELPHAAEEVDGQQARRKQTWERPEAVEVEIASMPEVQPDGGERGAQQKR